MSTESSFGRQFKPSAGHDAPRRVVHVGPRDEGRLIGDFLSGHCPEVPIGFLNRLLRKGFVRIGAVTADPRTRIKSGQRVSLHLPEGSFLVAPNPDVPFRIVYEDPDVAVVDKPAGVVSEPGIGHKLDTLLNGLVARYGEIMDRMGPEHDYGLVHRLDRDTSGIIIAARTVKSWENLTRQFRKHTVEKKYLALVVGEVAPSTGSIRIPLGRHRSAGRMRAVLKGPDSRPAETSYRVIERLPNATLVEAQPRTGRWHQVRLHFQAIRHPVAGDGEHGDAAANERFRNEIGLSRMFLHAEWLQFRHPATERTMEARAGIPTELVEALRRLRER